MLELKGVHYQPAISDQPVLQGLDLTVSIGKPALVAGPSGSGKTTLIEIISGMAQPQKGHVSWQGSNLNARQRRWLCGVVFQFPERHFLGLTVSQELRLGHRRLGHEDQIKVLRKVGLADISLQKAPEKLSGGEQRRLAVAVQLLRHPKILLLDEPTAGLDWSVRDEVLNLLANLALDQVLVVVTHEPELFKELPISSFELKSGKLLPTTRFK